MLKTEFLLYLAYGWQTEYILSSSTLHPWVTVGGNAVPRPAISAIWSSKASKECIFHKNARSQAGKILLSIVSELVNLNLVKITALVEI